MYFSYEALENKDVQDVFNDEGIISCGPVPDSCGGRPSITGGEKRKISNKSHRKSRRGGKSTPRRVKYQHYI